MTVTAITVPAAVPDLTTDDLVDVVAKALRAADPAGASFGMPVFRKEARIALTAAQHHLQHHLVTPGHQILAASRGLARQRFIEHDLDPAGVEHIDIAAVGGDARAIIEAVHSHDRSHGPADQQTRVGVGTVALLQHRITARNLGPAAAAAATEAGAEFLASQVQAALTSAGM